MKKEMVKKEMFLKLIAQKMLVLIVGLIVVGAALFVIGVLIEHSGSGTSAPLSAVQGRTSSTSPDADGGHESTGITQKSPAVQAQAGLPSETVFGLDLENPWFVGAFVLVWLVLIAALVRFGRIAWFALLLVAIVAAVLDGGEVARKVGAANSTVATFAVLVAAAHVALAVLALLVLARKARWGAVQSG